MRVRLPPSRRWWTWSAPSSNAAGARVKSATTPPRPASPASSRPISDIRTIELEYGRHFTWNDEEQASRVAIVGYDMADQLFGKRHILGETLQLERPAVHGRRQDPEEGAGQQLQRPGQQQDLRAVRGDDARHAAPRRRARNAVGHHRGAEGVRGRRAAGRCSTQRTGRIEDIDWPLEQNVRDDPCQAARLRSRRPAGDRRCGTRRSRR